MGHSIVTMCSHEALKGGCHVPTQLTNPRKIYDHVLALFELEVFGLLQFNHTHSCDVIIGAWAWREYEQTHQFEEHTCVYIDVVSLTSPPPPAFLVVTCTLDSELVVVNE